MACAESILTSQMSCIVQDLVSLLLSVHFPLSSYSHCFQQSSRAEKEVKVYVLLLRGSWRAGRGHATRLEGALCRCLGAGSYFIVSPETARSGNLALFCYKWC